MRQDELKKKFSSNTDPSFPGENWFFYWKTSSSLWKDKLNDFKNNVPIFIPVHWAFHHMLDSSFDFGSRRPETDIVRLCQIASQLGKEVALLIPLGPCPFLPNGGVPSFCSESLVKNKDDVVLACIDSENQVNKMSSFYSPLVYKQFRKFVWQLSQVIQNSPIGVDIYTLNCGYLSHGQFVSHLEDYSDSFFQGFQRFLEQKFKTSGVRPESIQEEEKLQIEYRELIFELYHQSIVDYFADNFEGDLKVALIGSSPYDVFARSSDNVEHSSQYFRPLFDSLTNGALPSTLLISGSIKDGILNKCVNDFITPAFIKAQLGNARYSDDIDLTFTPLCFYRFYQNEIDQRLQKNRWNELGILSYLERDFVGTYRYINSKHDNLRIEDLENLNQLMFFSSREMETDEFNKMIQYFMSSGRVCFDRSYLSEELQKRLENFIRENNLDYEKINYQTSIVKITLGEAIMIVFDGKGIESLPLLKKYSFWESIISFFDIKHLKVEAEEGVSYYWRDRAPYNNELKFQSIRRISLYNPTSYKRKVRVQSAKNFAMLKIGENFNSEVKTSPMGVDVYLNPDATVSLDYGFFEG